MAERYSETSKPLLFFLNKTVHAEKRVIIKSTKKRIMGENDSPEMVQGILGLVNQTNTPRRIVPIKKGIRNGDGRRFRRIF